LALRENDPAFFKIVKNCSFSLDFCKKRTTFCKKLPENCKKCSKNAPFWRPFAFAPPFLAQKRGLGIFENHKNGHKSL